MVELLRFMPPSSSGPGRGPLKAKTGVRVPLGAQASNLLSRFEIASFGFNCWHGLVSPANRSRDI